MGLGKKDLKYSKAHRLAEITGLSKLIEGVISHRSIDSNQLIDQLEENLAYLNTNMKLLFMELHHTHINDTNLQNYIQQIIYRNKHLDEPYLANSNTIEYLKYTPEYLYTSIIIFEHYF